MDNKPETLKSSGNTPCSNHLLGLIHKLINEDGTFEAQHLQGGEILFRRKVEIKKELVLLFPSDVDKRGWLSHNAVLLEENDRYQAAGIFDASAHLVCIRELHGSFEKMDGGIIRYTGATVQVETYIAKEW